MAPSPWNHTISVVRHHYYDRKPAFERESDVYGEWAAFAIEQGAFVYRIGEASGEAAAGQLVVCPPGVPFGRRMEQPVSFHYFLFHWLDSQGKPAGATDGRHPVCLPFRDQERFYATLATLRSSSFTGQSTFRLWRDHALLDLFRWQAMEEAMPPAAHRQAATDPQMEAARSMLDSVCEEPLSIGAVAEALSMSAVQFTRRFRQTFGVTPARYVEKIRLDQVCHLLTHTNLTIERIAQACGFSSGFYLSRYFTLKMQMPPSAYRQQYKV